MPLRLCIATLVLCLSADLASANRVARVRVGVHASKASHTLHVTGRSTGITVSRSVQRLSSSPVRSNDRARDVTIPGTQRLSGVRVKLQHTPEGLHFAVPKLRLTGTVRDNGTIRATLSGLKVTRQQGVQPALEGARQSQLFSEAQLAELEQGMDRANGNLYRENTSALRFTQEGLVATFSQQSPMQIIDETDMASIVAMSSGLDPVFDGSMHHYATILPASKEWDRQFRLIDATRFLTHPGDSPVQADWQVFSWFKPVTITFDAEVVGD